MPADRVVCGAAFYMARPKALAEGVGGQKRQAWTPEEDEILKQQVARFGTHCWPEVAAALKGRTSKVALLPVPHIIRPSDEPFSEWEIAVIVLAQRLCGNKWNDISRHLPMRCNNDIKNHFNLYLRDKQHQVAADNSFLSQGVTLAKLLSDEPHEVTRRRERLEKAKAAADSQSRLQPVKPSRVVSSLIHRAGGALKPQLQQPHQRRPYHPYLRVAPSHPPRAGAGLSMASGPKEQQQSQQHAFTAFSIPRLGSTVNLGAADSLALGISSLPSAGPVQYTSTSFLAYSSAAGRTGCIGLSLNLLPDQVVTPLKQEQQAFPAGALGSHGLISSNSGSSSGSSSSSSSSSCEYAVHPPYSSCTLGSLADARSSGSVSSVNMVGVACVPPVSPGSCVRGSQEDSNVRWRSRLHQASWPVHDAAGQHATGPLLCIQADAQQLPALKQEPLCSVGADLPTADSGCLWAGGSDVDHEPGILYSLFGSDDGALPTSDENAAGASQQQSQQQSQQGSCARVYPSGGSTPTGSCSTEELPLPVPGDQSCPSQQLDQLQLDLGSVMHRADTGAGSETGMLSAATTTTPTAYSPSASQGSVKADGPAAAAAVVVADAAPMATQHASPFAEVSIQQQQVHQLMSMQWQQQQQQSSASSMAAQMPLYNSSGRIATQAVSCWGCPGLLATESLLQSAALAVACIGAAPAVWGSGPDSSAAEPTHLSLLLPLANETDDVCDDLSDLEELLQIDDEPGALDAAAAAAAATGSDEGGSGLDECCDGDLALPEDMNVSYDVDEDECTLHRSDLQEHLRLLHHRSGSDALDALAAVW